MTFLTKSATGLLSLAIVSTPLTAHRHAWGQNDQSQQAEDSPASQTEKADSQSDAQDARDEESQDEESQDEESQTGEQNVSSPSDAEQQAAEGVGQGVGKMRQDQGRTDAEEGLSWRVGLLPYLGYQNLYDEFRHDEPWDSPHNRKLIPKMPPVYNTRGSRGAFGDGKTTVVALVSPRSVVTSELGGIRLNDIPDGASNTILFVGANSDQAVTWTRPEDIQFDPKQPLKGLGSRGYFQAVLADGSVHQIPATIGADTMRRLVYRDDGEPVTMNFRR